jgi:hypothetical protein
MAEDECGVRVGGEESVDNRKKKMKDGRCWVFGIKS